MMSSMGPNVVVVSLHLGNTAIWKIKRWEKGTPFLGWALDDGTFTPGLAATPEAWQSMVFRTAQFAVEWAEEHGWNVVDVIDR